MRRSSGPNDAEAALRRLGLARAAELQAALGSSQATVSRALTALGDRVARIGRARAARYALVAPIGSLGCRWPLFAIDAGARPEALGHLVALVGDRWLFEATDGACVLREGGRESGLYEGLPWYLADLRPQGFLGRLYAHNHAARLGAPADPALWRNEHVVAALLTDGVDAPGDLVLGERMLERVSQASLRDVAAVEEEQRAERYAELATAVLAGDFVGASAGGEQPKLACCVRARDGAPRHVLVKFTEPSRSPSKKRWVDLLIAEHHAAETLHAHGIAAARSEVVFGRERLFLEVPRFDRIGAFGRRGYVTLAALDRALYGASDDWRLAAQRLVRDGWLSREDGATLSTLYWFGGLIANSDMHFGNVSFARNDALPLALAPSYDMLPMLYRPAATGEIVTREFTAPVAPPAERAAWARAAEMARDFWQRVGGDLRVSEEFRRIAAGNALVVAAAKARFGA